jgi:hypothetical protein
MRGDFDEDEYDDEVGEYWDSDGCNRCGGTGTIIVCIDDMCRGAGGCMHGDGEIVCPDCGGE